MTPDMKLNESPIFIVGIFRSGTSLLCCLLNQNPALALMYECEVWNFPEVLQEKRFKRNWVERMEFFNQALSRHHLISENDTQGLDKIGTPMDLYRAFGAMKGATLCGEKSPAYCYRMEQLHRLYPGAAFILIWRNPLEVYRSVLKAGQRSRFFGQPGMLSRMIYYQEQFNLQSERIEKKGARVLRVDYANIVDQTENICREICAFLGVTFNPQMLEIDKADLSTIYKSPHHDYLRRGIIERQKYTQELVPPRIVKKLERYCHRWKRQQNKWLNHTAFVPNQSEPREVEFVYHNTLGRLLTIYDSVVRVSFEFMPLTWLRVYRLLKSWVVNPPSGLKDEKTSLVKDFRDHQLTILTATVLLVIIAFIHLHSNPHLLFILFYGIPCALLALVVNNRWASLFVIVCSILSPMIQYDGDPDYRSFGVFAWNFITRFILLEIFILTLGRIRLEFVKHNEKVG
jgi:hypothetical protein